MDTNNTNETLQKQNKATAANSSHTPLPRWRAASFAVCSPSQSSHRKFYMIVAGWLIVLGIAVAASLRSSSAGEFAPPTRGENAFFTPSCPASGAPSGSEIPDTVRLLAPIGSSMPSSFRNTRPNTLSGAEQLEPVRRILASGQRPLRVLQIGDSHVAGRSFPTALKSTLTACFGQATDETCGSGVWFSYIGSNGATSQRFLTDAYQLKFAARRPDLIIVSLGTNEAHGMGYSEDRHEMQLDRFLSSLRTSCPEAVILLTTPPGDYLTRQYINYRRTARSQRKVRQVRYVKRVNPMSVRCARFIAAYGSSHAMPVWDLFTICGGEQCAQRNWVTAHFMRPDRIHFQPAGYEVQGKLLGEALAQALTRR